MSQKKIGKNGILAFKLDMNKAYHRVEHDFLKTMLSIMEFHVHIVNLIMNCISITSFSFVIYGERINRFSPPRGLRQDNPISPYLFILCSKVFSLINTQMELVSHLLEVAQS